MSDDQLSALAAFLTGEPTAVTALLAAHVDDGHGRCRACTVGGQRGHATWPCSLFGAASAARAITDHKRRRTT